jgi:hypothetical protein
MYKYAIAATLAIALATPALAAEFFVALDTSTNQCHVMAQKPDGTTMKLVGSGAYKTQAEAQQAIRGLAECKS